MQTDSNTAHPYGLLKSSTEVIDLQQS